MKDVEDFLAHHGVKGMRWGVRKDRPGYISRSKSRYQSARTRQLREPFTVKSKNGETVDVKEDTPTSPLNSFIASLSNKMMRDYSNYSSFEISVGGNKVAEASFNKRSDDEIYLNWLGVSPDHRGKGYGSAVFDAAVQHGLREGAKKLTLEVPGNAPDARHIYEKQGFIATKEPSKWEKMNDPVWGGLTNMELDLTKRSVKHSDDDDDDILLERAFEQTFPKLTKEVEEAVFGSMEHNSIEDFLAHHGVKGMKWGVRKDQHRSYSEKASTTTEGMVKRAGSTVQMTRYFSQGASLKKQQKYTEEWYDSLSEGREFIRKGAVLNRVVRGVDDRALSGRLYVSQLASDNDMYKAVIPAVQKKLAFGQKEYHSVYQVDLKTKKRLSMPSEKERIDTFIETIKTPTGRAWMKENGYKSEITELNAKEMGLKAYKKFNKYAGNQDVKINDVYFGKIRAQGHGAILDDNDAGVWSKKPLILLQPNSTVRIKEVRQLSADDINAAQRRVLNNRDFKGKRE